MAEPLDECWECEKVGVEIFSEDNGFGRGYCKDCVQICVFCGGYCDTYGCANDEGEIDFDKHDCFVDTQITCNNSSAGKFRASIATV